MTQIALLDMYSKQVKTGIQTDTCMWNIHSSITPNSQNVEVTQVPINRWIDQQNMVYTHSGILFCPKKGWNSDTSYSMDEPCNTMLTKVSQTQKDQHCIITPTWNI